MAKITRETPSSALTSVEEYEVTDSAGRKIVVRKPGLLAQFRLAEAAGAEAAMNDRYMQMAMPLIYVASIDGETIPMPANKKQLDALIARIEVHGLNAVTDCLVKNFASSTPAEDKEAVKK